MCVFHLLTPNQKTGSSSPIPCPSGTYSSSYHATFCSDCPVGTFSNQVASIYSSDCTECQPGTFSNQTGSTFCHLATPGYFVPGYRATQSFPCGKGTFSENYGNSTCTRCPQAGYTTLSAGSSNSITDCVACPANTYHFFIPGFSSCISCPVGKMSPPGSIECF